MSIGSALKEAAVYPISAFVVGASFVSMIVGSTLALSFAVVGLPFRKTHHFAGALGLAVCPRFTFSQFEFIFDPAYDPDQRAVFMQNHVSALDGHVAAMTIPHPFCGLHLASHFKVPAYGWIMKQAGGIPVYPHKDGRTAEITAAAKNRVNDMGISILAFPEGHRTRDGQLGDFKRGVFFMARDAGVPVVPLAVRGLYDVNHAKSLRFRPGKVGIYVGRQLETEGLDDEGVHELTRKTRQIMADWTQRGILPDGVEEARRRGETTKKAMKARRKR